MSIAINGMDMPKGNSTKNLLIYSDGRVFTGHEDDVNYFAEELPPAQPEHKTGRWIDGSILTYSACSVCGYQERYAYENNFCPNCGADMR